MATTLCVFFLNLEKGENKGKKERKKEKTRENRGKKKRKKKRGSSAKIQARTDAVIPQRHMKRKIWRRPPKTATARTTLS